MDNLVVIDHSVGKPSAVRTWRKPFRKNLWSHGRRALRCRNKVAAEFPATSPRVYGPVVWNHPVVSGWLTKHMTNYPVSRIIIMNQQVDSKLLVLSILGMGKMGRFILHGSARLNRNGGFLMVVVLPNLSSHGWSFERWKLWFWVNYNELTTSEPWKS